MLKKLKLAGKATAAGIFIGKKITEKDKNGRTLEQKAREGIQRKLK